MTDTAPVPDYAGLMRLDDKGFIVLGAGQGMGRQSCHALAQMGAKVFCVDLERDRAEQVATEVGGIPWVADVTKRDDVETLVGEASGKMGSIDGIVDIVGISGWSGVLDIDDTEWDWQFDVVLRHAYLISQIAGRAMKESGGGTMVFIASVSGLTAAPNHAHYGAAKAGMMAWMQSVAIELAPYGIRANCVAPGAILTPRMEVLFDEERRKANDATVPMGHIGVPPDIAGAVLFLSAPISKFISGRTLVVDGGVDADFPYNPM
ncbi:MAG: SDR family NAD(P)-dependent oxidoreductase [bacterium]|nr:SDR family NAD(P)-dependent oxidoreductase [bacterium]MCY4194087.1 SDR family NAD(P)-dependent oxidoreductase [bacterium]MCY4271086.1 SDR family NAD(P)-dependent oxidoreductase [bacterium]